jgi:biotin synthase-like enzyme
MLHTLAEKLKQEHFQEVKKEFWSQIKKICTNLPCPYCSEHAKQFMSKVKEENIQSKHDIIHILYEFHNDVNRRLNKTIFDKNDISNTYSKNNTVQCYNNFMNRFSIATNHGMSFNKSLIAKYSLSGFHNWFTHNEYRFNK